MIGLSRSLKKEISEVGIGIKRSNEGKKLLNMLHYTMEVSIDLHDYTY